MVNCNLVLIIIVRTYAMHDPKLHSTSVSEFPCFLLPLLFNTSPTNAFTFVLAEHVSHMLATLAFSHMLVEHIHWKTDTLAVQQYAIVHV